MIEVIATAQGYDGICVREIGQIFEMPDDVFDKRQKVDEKGQPLDGQFHEPPSWFEPTDQSLRARVERDRKEAKRGFQRSSPAVGAVDPRSQQASQQAETRRLQEQQDAQRDAALKKAREEEIVENQRKKAEAERAKELEQAREEQARKADERDDEEKSDAGKKKK